ncbi:MAG: hypothetical protein HY705_05875 [Gemmatimonadetes bacterium]|nr:hypothetical protein [Gemmatimonadota bacterium]
MDRLIAELAGRSDVLAARDWLQRHDERTLALQCEIAAIAAPTGAEGERGRFLAQRMREAGLADVRQDAANRRRTAGTPLLQTPA